MQYKDISLGKTADEVLKNFYEHPGEMDRKPFGFDVHQGFEFFLGADNKLYKKGTGTATEMTLAEETEMRENLACGAVEFYLCRPSAGLPPYPIQDKYVIHAATGRTIPLN